MATYNNYKTDEPALQAMIPDHRVTVEPIVGADLYYTDGKAHAYTGKIVVSDRIDSVRMFHVYFPNGVEAINHPLYNKYKDVLLAWVACVESKP